MIIKLIVLSLKMVAFLIVVAIMFILGIIRDGLSWAVRKLRDFCKRYLMVPEIQPKMKSH
jgi:hypothetical protein